ncbi:hypothetical protein CsSME_00052451 [Camellia sinensis var. sinensis]
MSNSVCSVLVLFSLIFVSAQASRSLLTKPQPLPSFRIINTTTTHPLLAFSKVNSTTITATSQPLPPLKTKTATSQKENGACYYTVRFTTSCSSPSYTRDQISLDFGDAYGNEVPTPPPRNSILHTYLKIEYIKRFILNLAHFFNKFQFMSYTLNFYIMGY